MPCPCHFTPGNDLVRTVVQLFFYVLKFYLDTVLLYSQCTNLCLLCSDVVNYFLGHEYCIFLNWCSNVIPCYTNISYVMLKPQIIY